MPISPTTSNKAIYTSFSFYPFKKRGDAYAKGKNRERQTEPKNSLNMNASGSFQNVSFAHGYHPRHCLNFAACIGLLLSGIFSILDRLQHMSNKIL